MRILGISPFHDSSVCLLNNGVIEKFYKEERVSRIKRDKHPFSSLEKIAKQHDDIDVAVIASPSNGDYSLFAYEGFLRKYLKIPIIEDMSDEHHLQHASLAFYNSGFTRALVIVIDRNGSFVANSCRESESVFVAEYPYSFVELYKHYALENMNQETHRLSVEGLQKRYDTYQSTVDIDLSSTHGIVRTYESATTLIGQHVLENGKVMGLSAYGDYNGDNKSLFIDRNIGDFSTLSFLPESYESVNLLLHHKKTADITKDNYKFYADYAKEVQEETQVAAFNLIKKYVEMTGITEVCITGGYALNVVANKFYQDGMPDVNFYFEPLADDSGNSIGAAMLYHRYSTEDTAINRQTHTFYHGDTPNYTALDKTASKEKTTAEDVARLISEGNIVSIFYDKAEAGPRALGHRSILYDPRDAAAKDKVNKVKNREWYRPFAAAILKEDAQTLFDVADFTNTRSMTVNVAANEDAKQTVPGVLHVDNTCRLQLVEEQDSYLYELLMEFKKITGIGAVLNTSFNLAGEPLVETVEDALDTLKRSDIYAIWFPETGCLVR